METSDVIALIALAVAVGSGVVSWLSYRTNKRMATANEDMARANKSMAESNERMAKSNEEIASLTRAAVDHEKNVYQHAQSASFTFRQGKSNSSVDRIEFEHIFQNEGPHSALRVVHMLDRNGQPYATSNKTRMRPEVAVGDSLIVPCSVQIAELESGQTPLFVHRIRYRDGNGDHERDFHVRYSGTLHAGWSAQVVKEPNQKLAGG
jgi:hypothetical protein